MPAKEIVLFTKGGCLSEIYSSSNNILEFSFVNEIEKKLVQCHQWIKCKDYLHDAIRSMLTGENISIYGFKFHKGVNPDINLKKMHLLVKKSEDPKVLMKKLKCVLKIINYYENLVGVSSSKIFKVLGYDNVFEVKGPKFWISSPHLISLYTLLLRLSDEDIKLDKNSTIQQTLENLVKEGRKKNKLSKNLEYLESVHPYIEKILLKNDKLVDLLNNTGFSKFYFMNISINSFHNYSGILSVCNHTFWHSAFNDLIKKEIFNGEILENDK